MDAKVNEQVCHKLFIKEEDRQWTCELHDGETTIGRLSESTITLNDTAASRCHCKIVCDGKSYMLVDLGSSNGTRVNGVLTTCRKLCPGDRIVIGNTIIYFDKAPKNKTRVVEREVSSDSAIDRLPLAEKSLAYDFLVRDRLTGLYTDNYSSFQLAKQMATGNGGGDNVALLDIDVDRFQSVNDVHGYDTGDEVLQQLSETLTKAVGDQGVVGRCTGDSFIVTLKEADREKALKIAQRIVRDVEHQTYDAGERKLGMTVSVGVAVSCHGNKDIQELHHAADAALYMAKGRGGNQMCSVDECSQKALKTREQESQGNSSPLTRETMAVLAMVERLIGMGLDRRAVLEFSISMAVETVHAERGFLMTFDGDDLSVEVACNIDCTAVQSPYFKISHKIVSRVFSTGSSLLIGDANRDERFDDSESVVGLGLKSVLCVPIKTGRKVIGVVYMDNTSVARRFTDDDLALVQAFTCKIADLVDNSEESPKNEVKNLCPKEAVIFEPHTSKLKYRYDNIIGNSASIMSLFRQLDKIVDCSLPVVIQGESGTGKELVARAIHFNGSRKDMPFVAENCAAVPETLLESELFGHVRGAFTGAESNKKGFFELADGGTIFLDEIGDMSSRMQLDLLRVLEEKKVRRVGGSQFTDVDVRIICASNHDLKKLVEQGHFREDLFYRLNVLSVRLLPLRDRSEDIPMLVDHFLTRMSTECAPLSKSLSNDALQCLLAHTWPGNIRELRNVLERAVVMSPGDVINPDDIAFDYDTPDDKSSRSFSVPQQGPLSGSLKDRISAYERQLMQSVLDEVKWNQTTAAKILQIPRRTLCDKIRKYGLVQE